MRLRTAGDLCVAARAIALPATAAILCGYASAVVADAGAEAVPSTTASARAPGALEPQRRAEIAASLLARVEGEARALGLAAGWRESMLVVLLGQPSALLQQWSSQGLSYQGLIDAASRSTSLKALGDPAQDLVFKPLGPCRFIDTREFGGKLSPTPRLYSLANTGASYGGAAACNPIVLAGVANEDQIGALAMNVTIYDTSAGAPGYIAVRPAGANELSSLANWATASPTGQDANAAVVAMNQDQNTADNFEILASSPVHAIVDLLGAFVAPGATALDCVTRVNPSGNLTDGDLAPGQSAIFTSGCQTGYQVTGGGCFYLTPTQQPPAATDNKVILNASYRRYDGTNFLNSWTCHWTNNDSVTWRVQTRTMCCRVPGR